MAMRRSPFCATMGHTFIRQRFDGATEFGRPGSGSNHMMPLFISNPVEGETTDEPKADSSVWVIEIMLPCRSTMAKCVVQDGAFGASIPASATAVSPALASRLR